MEPERKRLSNQEIEAELTRIKRNGVTDNKVLELIRSDYQYGLSKEEIAIYLEKDFDMAQKQQLSKVIREQGAEVANAIAIEGLNVYAMQVAIDYYKKGIPLVQLVQHLEGDSSAFSLKQIYERVLSELKEADAKMSEAELGIDRAYLEKVLLDMKEIVLNINHDTKRYEAMTEKLKEIEIAKWAEDELSELQEQMEELETELEQTQERLQKVQESNLKLSKELEEKEEEVQRLKQRLQTQMPPVYTPHYPQMQQPRNPYSTEKQNAERAGVLRLFHRQEYKTQRQDIIKMVTGGQLNKEQLVQVKVAMERGLTNEQVASLIEGNLSAEQMKEIIEIAVLENSIR